jgi:hypothetical protein
MACPFHFWLIVQCFAAVLVAFAGTAVEKAALSTAQD